METSRDTSQVPKAIMIAGVRAMMVLSGRFTRFTHAHAPSSVHTTRTVRQTTKKRKRKKRETGVPRSGMKRMMLLRRVMQMRGKLVVNVKTGYKARMIATTSLAAPCKRFCGGREHTIQYTLMRQ
jgi:hypothetical protein